MVIASVLTYETSAPSFPMIILPLLLIVFALTVLALTVESLSMFKVSDTVKTPFFEAVVSSPTKSSDEFDVNVTLLTVTLSA